METMKNNREKLILEYAKLATSSVDEKSINRMSNIVDELQMTEKRIMEEATRLAIATFN